MRSGLIAVVRAFEMSKISWPSAESSCPMRRSGNGVRKFGPVYARKLKRREGRLGDHWHLDEVFLRINGQQHYLWRAVDQDGDVIDILVQPHRDQRAAERFFRRLWVGQGVEPLRIITDKLRSYSAAMRSVFGNVTHATPTIESQAHISRRANGERQMRRFKSARHVQRFLHSTMPSAIWSEWAALVKV